jgi:hypothetical protein
MSIGTIFNASAGRISFYLQSRYSFAQRKSVASAAPRYVFDVRDGDATNHLFFFLTQVVPVGAQQYLMFTYRVGGVASALSGGYAAEFYYVPSGTEDSLFGLGVTLKVTLAWDGSTEQLYLNDVLVKSTPYTPGTPNWTANSNFDLGAYEYLNAGGYNISDDVISAFTASGPSTPAPLGVSGVFAGSITTTGASISWTTNNPASSQVAYGITPSYGSLTPNDPTLVTAHSVALTGLAPATTYHYQVRSQDAQLTSASSGDLTFTTAAVSSPLLFQLRANPAEVNGTYNGAIVTPTIGPPGFTGQVQINGQGSVNFVSAHNGDGVYFLNCCANANNAWFEFDGATVGNLFNFNGGVITFYLTSRRNFANRVADPTPRWVFDARGGDLTNHWFYFLYQVTNVGTVPYLNFTYRVGGVASSVSSGYAAQFYFVPKGQEDVLFGNGVTLKVTMKWDGSVMQLYLNDNLVKSTAYVPGIPNWTNNSIFYFGAYEYLTVGVYEVTDDIISDFTIQ